jgi:hypothetical protein
VLTYPGGSVSFYYWFYYGDTNYKVGEFRFADEAQTVWTVDDIGALLAPAP